jgi:hypothetical protein
MAVNEPQGGGQYALPAELGVREGWHDRPKADLGV